MPTTTAAKKALKVSQKKYARNRRFLDLYKESTKQLEATLKAEKVDTKSVNEALSKVYSRIDTLEKKNILHKNNAARKKSAFAKMVASINS